MSDGLSVVIPAHDEEQSLAAVVAEVIAAGETLPVPFEVVIVDDGSTDATARIADELAAGDARVRAVHHLRNRGSGMAIRTGIGVAHLDLVTYVPADGQLDPAELGAYVAAAREADIVVGVREARSDYSPYRLLQSRIFLGLANRLFGMEFRDVNWVHLWRRELFDRLEPRSEGVLFLVEMLVLARAAGMRVVEIDSGYRPRRGGQAAGARPTTALETLRELLALRRRLRA